MHDWNRGGCNRLCSLRHLFGLPGITIRLIGQAVTFDQIVNGTTSPASFTANGDPESSSSPSV